MKSAHDGKRDLKNSLDMFAANSIRRNAKNDAAPSARLYGKNAANFLIALLAEARFNADSKGTLAIIDGEKERTRSIFPYIPDRSRSIVDAFAANFHA